MSSSPAPAGDGCCSGATATTTTTVSAETVAGSHVFVVNGYSRSKGALGLGRCVFSGTFTVGGHSWCVAYYPDGECDECAEFISLILHTREDVMARYEFSLLDQAGHGVPHHTVTCRTWTEFSRSQTGSAGVHLITREELESSPFLHDDGFRIKCDITVFKGIRPQVPVPDHHRRRAGLVVADGGGFTTTTIAAETVTGSHVLVIEGYSNAKGVRGVGVRDASGVFTVGGHRWCISYYLDGYKKESEDYIAFFLERLMEPGVEADVKARFKFSLLDQAGEPLVPYSHEFQMRTFKSTEAAFGSSRFLNRKKLEMSPYLRDDSFKIRCDVIVSKESTRTTTVQLPALPPSDLHQHLGNLLSSQVGADVAFEVGGETFTAHRYVLAARSPVFMAELYGMMKERTADRVRISDVEPEVFQAFLHFVYTDLLPEVDEGEKAVMAQHLLVAADTYNMQRLKLICERVLCIHIDTNTAATTLALAEQHGCPWLKEACFKFMASPCNFKGVMASDGFEHLMRSFRLSSRSWLPILLPSFLE